MMLRAGDDRQLMARVAALAAPTIAVTLLATMPLLGYTGEQVGGRAAVVVPGVLGASLTAWFLPWRRWQDRKSPGAQEYYKVSTRHRIMVAAVYLGLIALLVAGMDHTHVTRTFGDA